ncbi:hypothetical protein [Streptomyces sp. PvR034]|uniref:hypothetical protein n=1 Tax=Streptomyces sp. PvR034 TaxID=3156401 RepID=UPI00339A31AE
MRTSALCTTVTRDDDGELHGDPTEMALVEGPLPTPLQPTSTTGTPGAAPSSASTPGCA